MVSRVFLWIFRNTSVTVYYTTLYYAEYLMENDADKTTDYISRTLVDRLNNSRAPTGYVTDFDYLNETMLDKLDEQSMWRTILTFFKCQICSRAVCFE
jgi:hypothetical protein